jgi:D-tyrosyl-tRNA(Tyr) deacylase
MRIVAQRVSRAEVRVGGRPVGTIGRGLLLLVAVERGDGPAQAERAAHRFATLRTFEDEQGKLNRGLDEVGGEVLAVSQFTVAGSIQKGRRPDFFAAASPGRPSRSSMRSSGSSAGPGCGWRPACSAPTWRSSWSTTAR